MQRPLSRGGSLLLAMLMAGPLVGQGPWYEKIGEGCAGTSSTPVLTAKASAVPILGQVFSTELSNAPDGSAIGILGLSTNSWGPLGLPIELDVFLMPDCWLYTDLRRARPLEVVGGRATWDFQMPTSTVWLGQSFYQQALVLDAGELGENAVISNANRGIITAPQPAPFASISFPPPNSLTDHETVLVRGKAFDPDGVTEVWVNGLPAESQDEFANWQVRVPIGNGSNALVVAARDGLGNLALPADQARIESQAVLSNPRGIAIDRLNNRALVVDRHHPAVIEIDLESENRRLISSSTRGTGPELVYPVDIALDGARALVADRFLEAIISVDLLSGDRVTLSGMGVGSGPEFGSLGGVEVLATQALVLDVEADRLFWVDLVSGDRRILSDANHGIGPLFPSPTGIAANSTHAFLTDSSIDAVIAIDLTTGDRSILSDPSTGTGPFFGTPLSIAVDGNRLLLLEASWHKGVLAIDIASGDRSIISYRDIGTGPEFNRPEKLALDGNRVLISESISVTTAGRGRILAVDLTSGDRSILDSPTVGSGSAFLDLEGIVVDGTRVLVVERWPRPLFIEPPPVVTWNDDGAIVAVDLLTGDRSDFSGRSAGLGAGIVNPQGIAMDGKRALLTMYVDTGFGHSGAVLAIDLATGDRSQHSASGSSGPSLDQPFSIAVAGSRAAILKRRDDNYNYQYVFSFLGMDLESGDRWNLIGAGSGTGPGFERPQAIALHDSQLLATDGPGQALISIDFDSGERAVVSDANIGTGPAFEAPGNMTVRGQSALILDWFLDALFAVDLETGARRLVSAPGIGLGPPLSSPEGIAVSGDLAFVSEDSSRSIIAVDLVTGERAIISM